MVSPPALFDKVPSTSTVLSPHFGAESLGGFMVITASAKSMLFWKKTSEGLESCGTSYITTAAAFGDSGIRARPGLNVFSGELLRFIGEAKLCPLSPLKVARTSLFAKSIELSSHTTYTPSADTPTAGSIDLPLFELKSAGTP